MQPSYAKICPRRSTKSDWELFNPILLEGEIGVEYPDTGVGTGLVKIKFGDGVNHWLDLPYGIDLSEASAIHGGDAVYYNDICLRSDDYNRWMNENPIIGIGEIVYDKSNNRIKVGDGVHPFSDLKYIGYNEDMDMDLDFGDEDANPL